MTTKQQLKERLQILGNSIKEHRNLADRLESQQKKVSMQYYQLQKHEHDYMATKILRTETGYHNEAICRKCGKVLIQDD